MAERASEPGALPWVGGQRLRGGDPSDRQSAVAAAMNSLPDVSLASSGLGALLVLGVVLGVPQAFMKAAMRSHLNRGSSSRTEER